LKGHGRNPALKDNPRTMYARVPAMMSTLGMGPGTITNQMPLGIFAGVVTGEGT
jgi:hypothetical protein